MSEESREPAESLKNADAASSEPVKNAASDSAVTSDGAVNYADSAVSDDAENPADVPYAEPVNAAELREIQEFMQSLYARVRIPFVTYSLIAVSVVIYLLMGVFTGGWISPSGEALVRFGSDYGPMTLYRGEWWRMLTCSFVHIGIIHLAFNMYVLYQVGPFLERLYGRSLFFLLYVGSAFTGSLLSLGMNPFQISAGASGAIFGLFGAVLGFYLCFRSTLPRKMFSSIASDAGIFIVFNLIFGLQAGIDNWAHLGGLFGGFFFGFAAAVAPNMESGKRRISVLIRGSILAFLIAFLTLGAFLYVKNANAFTFFAVQYDALEQHMSETAAVLNGAGAQVQGEADIPSESAESEEELLKKMENILHSCQEMKDLCAKSSEMAMNAKQSVIFSWLSEIADVRTEMFQTAIQAEREQNEELSKKAEALGARLEELMKEPPAGVK